MLDSRPRGCGFERHCVVSLSKNINPSLVLVQPRKTCPFITKRLLMGRKESNQTNKNKVKTVRGSDNEAPHFRAIREEIQVGNEVNRKARNKFGETALYTDGLQ